MHNMIIENEEGEDFNNFLKAIQVVLVQRELTFGQLLQGTFELEDHRTHFVLKNDLVKHLWAQKGDATLWLKEIPSKNSLVLARH